MTNDEIDRLRAELDQARQERDDAQGHVSHLMNNLNQARVGRTYAEDAIGRVRALLADWNLRAGPGSDAHRVFGRQVVSVEFAQSEIENALTGIPASPLPNGPARWDEPTPLGHVYETPTTYAKLRRITDDMIQANCEHWNLPEHPPQPTWEMVGLAHEQVRHLRFQLERIQHICDQQTRNRE